MDIKDFILIGGGLLIAAVVAHGFWIAWRARRDPLRIDLVRDLPGADDGDDIERLRAELPNGGSRVVGPGEVPRQGDLDLERRGGRRAEPVLADAPEPPRSGADATSGAPERTATASEPVAPRPTAASRRTAPPARRKAEPRLGPDSPPAHEPAPEREPPAGRRDRVRDVIMPERDTRADEPKEPRRWSARKPAAEARGDDKAGARSGRGGVQGAPESAKPEETVDELIVLNVLAPKGRPFVGGGVVEALRARGLRYGRMNIFHRIDPMTRQSLYSVANVVEPGTFDMADLDNFRSPGVCFFLQLPGPEHPLETFEDMLKVARDVAVRVGGELKDEQRSVMTGQTVEHYRARISEFCRRRMSMRA